MQNIIMEIKKLRKDGFFAIYLSTILTKVIVLFGGILIVRLLSIDEYANYTLINNAFSMLTILGDFGTTSALFLFLVQEKNNNKKYDAYLKYGIKYAVTTSFFSSLFILLSPFFYPYKNQLILSYSLFLCMIPLLNVLFGIVNMILRSKEENKKYSIFQVIAILIHYISAVSMTKLFGLKGSIVCQYVYGILIVLVGFFILIHYNIIKFDKNKNKLTKKNKKEFMKLAFSSQFANLTSYFLYSVDIFVIGLVITNNEQVSLYKVSTVIPNALAFLPGCLMMYLLPKFVKNSKNEQWIMTQLKKIILYGFVIYFLIYLFFSIFSKNIILILYGEKYIDSVYPFLILMVGFLINATFCVPICNIICALKKHNYNTITNTIAILCNVTLNYIFIKKFGYIGASITTTLVTILSSVLSFIFLKKILKSNKEVSNE